MPGIIPQWEMTTEIIREPKIEKCPESQLLWEQTIAAGQERKREGEEGRKEGRTDREESMRMKERRKTRNTGKMIKNRRR